MFSVTILFKFLKTFITISTMNTKSGKNEILPHRTKRGITLDLQKQMI